MFVVTGNNLVLVSDTCTRIMTARLDAGMERPQERKFFSDPEAMLLADRGRYVVAALTIIRAYITAGRPKAPAGGIGDTGTRFKEWDALVRQPLCWLARLVASVTDTTLPVIGDPAGASLAAYEADPETAKLRALLHAWFTEFRDTPVKAASVVAKAGNGVQHGATEPTTLYLAAADAGGKSGRPDAYFLGLYLRRSKDRMIDGMRFVSEKISGGSAMWKIEGQPPTDRNIPPHPPDPPSVRPWSGSVGGMQGDEGDFSINAHADVEAM
jgi:hypothetical protein